MAPADVFGDGVTITGTRFDSQVEFKQTAPRIKPGLVSDSDTQKAWTHSCLENAVPSDKGTSYL
jgi:hypothetical protein